MEDNSKAILVPVDFTPAASQAAISAAELAAKLNAEVHLINFIPPIDSKILNHSGNVSDVSEELSSSINLLKENEQKLAEFAKSIELPEVKVFPEIVMERFVPGLKKQLKKKNIGLVVIGINGIRSIGESLYHTKYASDLVKLKCPLMICNGHEHHFQGKHRLVVSLDFDDLDQNNIEYIDYIARELDVKVHYLHVNHPEDKKQCTVHDIEQYLKAHNLHAESIDIIDSEHKEEAIRHYAHDHNADLIAINKINRKSEFKECHAEQMVDESESLVFVY